MHGEASKPGTRKTLLIPQAVHPRSDGVQGVGGSNPLAPTNYKVGDVPIPGEMKKAAQVAWLMQVNTNYQE